MRDDSIDKVKDQLLMSNVPAQVINFVEELFINKEYPLDKVITRDIDINAHFRKLYEKEIENRTQRNSDDNISEYIIKNESSDGYFSRADLEKSDKKGKYLFSYFPFGMRVLEEKYDYLCQSFLKNNLELNRKNSADSFIFNMLLNKITEKGLAVALVSGRVLYNHADEEIRKQLVKKGLIEAVIELPEKLFIGTGIKTYLVLLSFGNKSIKFVNLANAFYQTGRQKNILDINKALEIYNDSNENTVCIENDELLHLEVNLLPEYQLRKKLNINLKTKTINELSQIFTGWQVSSKKLDEIYKDDINNEQLSQIIQMSDIDDGLVTSNSYYLVDNTQYKRFALENSDVLITTKSFKVKVAVLQKGDKRMIASGNIMVIRVNKELLDPYYLAAYLESVEGRNQLSLKQIGSIVKNLTINNVKLLEVPLINLDEQKKIGRIYRQKMGEVRTFRKIANNILKETEDLFDFIKE